MTEFLTKPSPKVASAVKVAGGGLGAGALIFLYATFVSKDEMRAAEDRAAMQRAEIRAFQTETWQKLMDVQIAAQETRAMLDMLVRMRSGLPKTNAVVLQ